MLVCAGRVTEDAHNLAFRKDVSIIQGKKQRFANRKGRMSGSVRSGGHGIRLSGDFLISFRIVAGKSGSGLMQISLPTGHLSNMVRQSGACGAKMRKA